MNTSLVVVIVLAAVLLFGFGLVIVFRGSNSQNAGGDESEYFRQAIKLWRDAVVKIDEMTRRNVVELGSARERLTDVNQSIGKLTKQIHALEEEVHSLRVQANTDRGDALEHRAAQPPTVDSAADSHDAKSLALDDAKALALVDAEEFALGDAKGLTLGDAKALALDDAKALALDDAKALAIEDAKALAIEDAKALTLVDAEGLALGSSARSFDDFVSEVARKVEAETPLISLLDYIYDELRVFVPCQRMGYAEIDYEADQVSAVWSRSEQPTQLKTGYSAPLSESSLRFVASENRPRMLLNLHEYLAQHPTSHSTRFLVEEGFSSSLTFPVAVNETVVGFLFLTSIDVDGFDDVGVAWVRELAALIGRAVLPAQEASLV